MFGICVIYFIPHYLCVRSGWPGTPHEAGPPLLRMDATGTPTVALVEGGLYNEPRRFIRKFNGEIGQRAGSTYAEAFRLVYLDRD